MLLMDQCLLCVSLDVNEPFGYIQKAHLHPKIHREDTDPSVAYWGLLFKVNDVVS